MPLVRPAIASAAALAALAVLAPNAVAAPRARVVANPLGNVRQVELGDRHIVWTRCVSPKGPTELWSARATGGRSRRVGGIRAPGPCDGVTLVGSFRDQAVVIVRNNAGLARLDSVDVRTGRRTPLEAETPAASGVRIVAADTSGPRVAWMREVGSGDARVSETVVGDLRGAFDGTFGGAPRRVVYSRSLQWMPVVPTGVWIGPDGSVVVREAIRGAVYGYGNGTDRLSLVTSTGSLRQLARPGDGFAIAGADLTRRHLTYSLLHPPSGRVWMFVLDRRTNRRRLVRRLAVPAALPPYAPAIPVAHLDGTRMAWRERRRVRRGFTDRVLVRSLTNRRVHLVARVDDSRGQRAFVSPPALRGRRVAWAQVTLPTAQGATGGYYGLSPVGAQARVLTATVR